ncbi:MAG: type II toxin-antitoxin system VapB family antitoxin [Rhizobium sp.]|nr:type II toxin-antitoxin system VapB family antitoxin [Rhizobium sp.]
MALYVKDAEVDRLASQPAEARGTTKTEALRQALRDEIQREQDNDFVERVMAFARRARALGNPKEGKPADKAFRDSFYED